MFKLFDVITRFNLCLISLKEEGLEDLHAKYSIIAIVLWVIFGITFILYLLPIVSMAAHLLKMEFPGQMDFPGNLYKNDENKSLTP